MEQAFMIMQIMPVECSIRASYANDELVIQFTRMVFDDGPPAMKNLKEYLNISIMSFHNLSLISKAFLRIHDMIEMNQWLEGSFFTDDL